MQLLGGELWRCTLTCVRKDRHACTSPSTYTISKSIFVAHPYRYALRIPPAFTTINSIQANPSHSCPL